MLYKKYIDVIQKQTKDGETIPMYICWENGKQYIVDKVLRTDRRASVVGGCGMRYTCLVEGRRKCLFLEKDRWFVESSQP